MTANVAISEEGISGEQANDCGNCRFWLHMTSDLGLCRRQPPTIQQTWRGMEKEAYITLNQIADRSKYPATSCDDWCGEHEPKPEAAHEKN